MKQGTKRLLSMALSLALIVGSFVIYFDITQPAYEALQKKRSEQLSREKVISDEQQAVQKVQILISQYSGENEASLKQVISAALPLGPDLGSALVQLAGLGEASGLVLQSLTPRVAGQAPGGQAGVVKPVGTVDWQLTFVGSYESFKGFLKKLESNIMIFEVKSVNLQPLTGRGGGGNYSFNLNLKSYYQIL